jgi:hypothetical protein
MRIFALFNLKPGVSEESYRAWARDVDVPNVNRLGSVDSFQVFRATGRLGSDDAPPYAFIEILDINDMDAFGRDVATPAMQEVASAFQALADVVFLTTDRIA